MANRSKIEWTESTWTPIRARWFAPTNDGGSKERVGWHCEHVSEGCRNCYAEGINRRLGTGLDFKPGNLHRADRVGYANGESKVFLDEKMLLQPLRWSRPRRIFVCSMTDLFASFVPDEIIDRVFAVMSLCPQHILQVLTKRSGRMRAYLSDPNTPGRIARICVDLWIAKVVEPDDNWPVDSVGPVDLPDDLVMRFWPLPNVWLGVSAEDQATADARVPELLATPAALRFVSAEPLLGPIDFTDMDPDGKFRPYGAHGWSAIWRNNGLGRAWLDWIIVGGESGPGARPMHPDWARSIRDQCAVAGVAFHFKQHGAWSALEAGEGEWPSDAGSLIRLRPDGSRCDDGWPMQRVGKKLAGRLLDGVTHNGMPGLRPC